MNLREKLQLVKTNYSSAKILQDRREELERRFQKNLKDQKQIELAKLYTKQIREDITNELNAYKKSRLALLEQSTQSNLNEVFPHRDFKVKFEPDVVYNQEVLELLVGEGDRLDPPDMQNGRGLRQVVALSIVSIIQIKKGCKLLMFDEAINSADGETSILISALIENLVKLGYQVIMIEHEHRAYNTLSRRQFNLSLNDNKEVEVEVREYE